MSKPGVTLPPGSARGNPEACPSGIRHVGGAKLNQALVRNVRTCPPMQRERSQAAQTARIGVPMRGPGTEQPVVGTKALYWSWTERAALFSRDHGPTAAIWQRQEPIDDATPFHIA